MWKSYERLLILISGEATGYDHWLAAHQSEDNMPLSWALASVVGRPLQSFQTAGIARGGRAVDVIYPPKTSPECIQIPI